MWQLGEKFKRMKRMIVSFIGSGNVATHLANELFDRNCKVLQILSRNNQHALALAHQVQAQAITNFAELDSFVDILFVCVNDQAIDRVINQLPNSAALIVHTAGSISIDVLNRFSNHGVFYPFQTFSKQKRIDFSEVPILIEANNDKSLSQLQELGSELSETVILADSNRRCNLHIAAVFSCNFVNHLYALANDVLFENGLNFNLLYPLIEETTKKIKHLSPIDAQTGPAVRRDENTITKHVGILDKHPDIQKVYQLLSENIREYHS